MCITRHVPNRNKTEIKVESSLARSGVRSGMCNTPTRNICFTNEHLTETVLCLRWLHNEAHMTRQFIYYSHKMMRSNYLPHDCFQAFPYALVSVSIWKILYLVNWYSYR